MTARPVATPTAFPPAQGLYSPEQEHDACGVAFVVDIAGRQSHEIIDQGLTALRNMEHRGASGSEPDSGDVDAFWRDVERSVKGMRSEASTRSRLLGRLSLRSFARRRRERRRR